MVVDFAPFLYHSSPILAKEKPYLIRITRFLPTGTEVILENTCLLRQATRRASRTWGSFSPGVETLAVQH